MPQVLQGILRLQVVLHILVLMQVAVGEVQRVAVSGWEAKQPPKS